MSLLLQHCAKGPLHSPAPSPSSLGLVSLSLLGIPHNHLHPHTRVVFFLHSFLLCDWLSLYLLLFLFSCLLSPQPQPHCLHARDSVTPWSLQVHGPPLLYSKAKSYSPQGNTTVVWLDPDTEKNPNPQESFLSTNPVEIFGAC